MWGSVDVKRLGVAIDRELKFDKHVFKIFSKASRKLTVLDKMATVLTFGKAFFELKIKYCPLVWMFQN